jgi:hypothetical protein
LNEVLAWLGEDAILIEKLPELIVVLDHDTAILRVFEV